MKKLYFWAPALAAILTMAACTAEDDIVVSSPDVNPPNEETPAPILFSSLRSNITRAGENDIKGAEAAEKLGNKFVVFGYKGSKTATPGSTVFDNYVVNYKENTAYTTESNTANWEYVGQERIKHAIDNGVTQQAIKFWDYSKDQYDFIAWSTGKVTAIYDGTPNDGEVLVSAIKPETSTVPAGLKAFTMQGMAKDLEQCYVTDIVTVKKDGTGTGKYGETVTLKFRSLGSKVRIGIYETIPGYSVKDVKFYSAAASNDADADPKLFTVTANDIYTEGKYTIYYPTVDVAKDVEDYNHAHVKFAGTGTQSTVVVFDDLNYTTREDGEKGTGNMYLGRTSNTATYAGNAEGNYYTQYLPNEGGSSLNLRVDYTLESIDGSGETILVRGATAQVPDIYTKWKAGYAYTYLFKISDKTNGHTGTYDPTKPDDTTANSDPAGLYPITFDAVVVNDEEDATQETITLVSTPSITTYQEGSKVVDNNEYLAATGDIYVTVNDGTKESTPDLDHAKLQPLDGKAKLYTLVAGKTEADVVDALKYQDPDYTGPATICGRSGLLLTEQTLTLTNEIKYGVDGNTIKVGTNEAAKFTPAAGTYAFVYTKKAPTDPVEVKYERVSKAKGESVEGLYRPALRSATGDVKKGVAYFKSLKSDMVTVFLGQTVDNLYLDAAGTQNAKGYAKTGTDYYYTVTSGMSYIKAHNVAYADFASAVLYTKQGNTYTAKPETATEPENGVAYYYKDGNSYIYCVILPEQAESSKLYTLDETSKKKIDWANPKAVKGGIYFDKFTQNDGVYYTKVIKVE